MIVSPFIFYILISLLKVLSVWVDREALFFMAFAPFPFYGVKKRAPSRTLYIVFGGAFCVNMLLCTYYVFLLGLISFAVAPEVFP